MPVKLEIYLSIFSALLCVKLHRHEIMPVTHLYVFSSLGINRNFCTLNGILHLLKFKSCLAYY